jgi:excisionase family DNA binding protein
MKMRDHNVTSLETTRISTPQQGTLRGRRLLRLKAGAEYLSLSPWKVRSLIKSGRLPVVQDGEGSPFLLDVRDLDGYVERNKRAAPLEIQRKKEET